MTFRSNRMMASTGRVHANNAAHRRPSSQPGQTPPATGGGCSGAHAQRQRELMQAKESAKCPPQTSTRHEIHPDSTHQPCSSGEVSVLVVEDDAATRNLLAEALDLDGYQVYLAQDGLAALDVVRREPPDVVILDLGLPVLDGQEFLDAWRTAVPSHSVPVLVLSATAEPLPSSATLGVLRHMTKPFDVDAVVGAVGRLAAGHRT
jgi:CheY-like chemotaxis protein